MPWDTWALVSIAILCSSVILWSWWGFHSQPQPPAPTALRLSIIGGGYLEVPHQSGYPPGRHRPERRQSPSHARTPR
ncbi:hypothetical protein ACFXHA_22410 [Nocardia sp. NPDC059240]|uniref:hypothetical protein n=1 Tax=Nocardia sp. NPDC059240 TaxID=3346786 RepID=UPI0036C7D7CE